MKELQTITDGSILSVDNAFKLLKTMEEQVDILKDQEKRISGERKRLESYLKDADSFIKKYMVENGLAELEGTQIKYYIHPSNPRLIIDDESIVPKDYKEETVITTIRKDAIKDQLKMGDEIPGCRLEESFALKIKVK